MRDIYRNRPIRILLEASGILQLTFPGNFSLWDRAKEGIKLWAGPNIARSDAAVHEFGNRRNPLYDQAVILDAVGIAATVALTHFLPNFFPDGKNLLGNITKDLLCLYAEKTAVNIPSLTIDAFLRDIRWPRRIRRR